MRTPVALILFNRTETTERVFAQIAKARPPKLFLIADGPRASRPDERAKCDAARAVVERVDWDCEVFRNYADANLGCGLRPATGISWVYEHVEEAIILEDDCVPDPSFFSFCDEMLERYRDDERVMMVSGDNFLPSGGGMKASYTFFRYLNTFGWATWRRAWRHYDFELRQWPSLRRSGWLRTISSNPRVRRFWKRIFDRVYVRARSADVWDYQLIFSVMARGGLGIAPATNLVSNIGFGEGATHPSEDERIAGQPTRSLGFPLRHPEEVRRDEAYDQAIFDQVFLSPNAPPEPSLHRLKEMLKEFAPLHARRWIKQHPPSLSRRARARH